MTKSTVRDTFLASSRIALEFVGSEQVAERWDFPSALPEFSLRGLAGHLFRATGSVETYLDRDEPSGSPVDAPEYFATAVEEPDIDSDLHRAVRQRGEEAAAGGHAALVEEWDAMVRRLETRLASEPAERLVSVYKGLVIRLDDYLVTRLLELVVHSDDLAASLDTDPPVLPEDAFDAAIGCLVEMARRRHGDAAVVRSLTRRERDALEALRVL